MARHVDLGHDCDEAVGGVTSRGPHIAPSCRTPRSASHLRAPAVNGQVGPRRDFDPPALIVRKMQVQAVQLVERHQVDVALDDGDGMKWRATSSRRLRQANRGASTIGRATARPDVLCPPVRRRVRRTQAGVGETTARRRRARRARWRESSRHRSPRPARRPPFSSGRPAKLQQDGAARRRRLRRLDARRPRRGGNADEIGRVPGDAHGALVAARDGHHGFRQTP